MSTSAGRAKRDRERARQERAALKRSRKLEDASAPAEEEIIDPFQGSVRRSQNEVLEELAALHQRFEAEAISFEDFESAKGHLMGQLDVG